jgi:signal transduction histidine kinase
MSEIRMEEALRRAQRREEPGEREGAIALLEALVAEAPEEPRARFLLASLYDDRAETFPQAERHYRKGLALEPANAAARNNLAVALMGLHRSAEAVEELCAVLLTDPGYGLAARNLAEVATDQLSDAQLLAVMERLAGRGESLVRFARALEDAGRQDAFEAVYGAGHALKNLVGLAGSQATALARRMPEEPAASALGEALQKVYGDFASLLKTAKAGTQRHRPCDLNSIARDVGHTFEEPARPALSLVEPAPQALGDPAALREAVLNLARNAREAAPRGRVEISTRSAADGRLVEIAVQDDGPGIAPSHLRRIFAPGFTTKPQGSGFGLSIAERAAHALGGRIDVESRPGRGARFALVLPAATEPPARLAPRLSPEEFAR